MTGASGIIPACAGNTSPAETAFTSRSDHPRMRGEHSEPERYVTLDPGSSPHARGTPCAASNRRRCRGIIPACAGNTPQQDWKRLRNWDHPRMRGEHYVPDKTITYIGGSSPHARGTRAPSQASYAREGIIPACAGNTMRRVQPETVSRDHPRMRGEHSATRLETVTELGSSPHARGTLRAG